MPQLLPFAGLRPGLAVVGSVDAVICPPYDIITEEERAALLARSPYNVVRVELPNGQYGEAARLLQGMRGRPGHIVNLGHGILPEAKIECVEALVQTVVEWK